MSCIFNLHFPENDGGKIKTSKINIVIENNFILIYL